MECPVCRCIQQRFLIEQLGRWNQETPHDIEKSDILLIACAKCNLTLWTPGEGWRDWSDTTLYYDEDRQRLEMRSQPRTGSYHKPDPLVSAIKTLPIDVIKALIEEAEKEKKDATVRH